MWAEHYDLYEQDMVVKHYLMEEYVVVDVSWMNKFISQGASET
jgi:hypothetical protein